MSQKFNVGIIIMAILLATTIGVAPILTTNPVTAQLFFQGPPGQNGTQGPPGPMGPPGPAAQAMNLTIRNVPGSIVSLAGLTQSVATCNPDESVTGGGYSITNGPGIVLSSALQGNSWIVHAVNPFAFGNSSVQAFAECASIN
jgi:hypothetical protein